MDNLRKGAYVNISTLTYAQHVLIGQMFLESDNALNKSVFPSEGCFETCQYLLWAPDGHLLYIDRPSDGGGTHEVSPDAFINRLPPIGEECRVWHEKTQLVDCTIIAHLSPEESGRSEWAVVYTYPPAGESIRQVGTTTAGLLRPKVDKRELFVEEALECIKTPNIYTIRCVFDAIKEGKFTGVTLKEED